MSVTTKQKHRTSHRGFSLIEVLLSLSILAAGLLGVTAMQNEALQFSNAALLDSQAQFLINDMVERIRANRGNDLYAIQYTEDEPTPAVDCSANTCTSNQMAQWDVAQWRGRVEDTNYLPSGESQILFNTLNREFTVSVRYNWSQLGNTNVSGETRTVSVTTRIE